MDFRPISRIATAMDSDQRYKSEYLRVYDAWTRTTLREDAAYYTALADDVDGAVLELGCGTGRVYLSVLETGADADGIDLSSDALIICRQRGAEMGLDPTLWQADMVTLSVGRRYELVYCPFNSVQHVTALEDQQRLLERVYDALVPGGRFVFDTYVPRIKRGDEMYGEWITQEVVHNDELYEFATHLQIADEVEQSYTVTHELRNTDGETLYTTGNRAKLLPKRETELLVRNSPFDDYTVAGDFTDEPIADGHDTQVWTLKRHAE